MEILLTRELTHSKTVNRIFGVTVFVILMCLGAFVRIPLPFNPVPLTLQTFFVLLSGACLAGNLGMFSQLVYVALGITGFPLFTAAGSGWLYLFGPTGGYIFGFVLAALLIGRLIKYSAKTIFSVFILFCLADLLLLACGALWLKLVTGCSLTQAVFMGFLPFIPGDLLKAAAAAGVYSRMGCRCREIF
jgi:biotin transport system substrate-specific component